MVSDSHREILMERGPLPIIGIDRNGALIYANDTLCALLGHARDDILGRKFWDFLDRDRGRLLKERFLRDRDRGIFRQFETTVRSQSRDDSVISWHNVPFHDSNGRLTEVFSIGADVSPLRRAEARLERLNATLDALSQISRLALRTNDPRDLLDGAADILVSSRVCTGAWIALVGSDGRPVGLVGSPHDEDGMPFQLLAGRREVPPCIARVLSGSPEVTVAEISHTCPECVFTGSDTNVHGVTTVVRHGNNLQGVLVAHLRKPVPGADETRRLFRTIAHDLGFALAMLEAQAMHERAERALAEQTRMLDAFFEASLDPAALLDRDFNFVRVNRAYAETDDRAPCDFIGRNHFELFPDEENKRIFEHVRDTGEPYEVRAKPFIYANNPERGTTYWDWTLVPIFGDGGEVELLSLWLRDVTEECLAREELRRNQDRLRELTAQLAMTEQRERREIAAALHDNLGQTLAFAKMRLGALKQSSSTDTENIDIDEVVDFIDEGIHFTRSLTAQLSPPILSEMGLVAALEALVEDLADRHDLCVTLECEKDCGRMDEQIETTLFQATRELLHNAIKHADPEQVRVRCVSNPERVHIEVEDDGAGFDVSQLQHPNSTTKGGFGLLSVQERLRYLGGEVEIESEPNDGTVVRLVSPRANREKTPG